MYDVWPYNSIALKVWSKNIIAYFHGFLKAKLDAIEFGYTIKMTVLFISCSKRQKGTLSRWKGFFFL